MGLDAYWPTGGGAPALHRLDELSAIDGARLPLDLPTPAEDTAFSGEIAVSAPAKLE